jgi:two-component system NtrC family sensor kinase
MSHEASYKRLRRSMTSMLILVSLTPLLMVSALLGDRFHTSYKEKALAHLDEVLLKHEQTIDSFLDSKVAELRVLVDVTPFKAFFDPEVLGGLLLSLQNRHHGAFVDLGVVDSVGEQVAYAGPFRLGSADYSQANWFQAAMRRQVYISDVFLGVRGLPHFIVAVRKKFEGRDWIVRSTIDFAAFNRLVENVRIGDTGLAFIVNKEGEFQTSPRMDISSELPELLTLIRNRGKRGSGQWLSRSKDGSGVWASIFDGPFTDQPYVVLMTELKGGDWTLIYQQAEKDAFQELYRSRIAVIVMVAFGASAIVAAALYVSQRFVNHLRRLDREKEIMNEQMLEAGRLASVGELAAGVAHEINNPVAIMTEEAGWIEDLLEDENPWESEAEIRRALAQIKTQGGRCREITHKLLSFARKIDPTAMPLDLNQAVEEIAELSEQRARYASVRIVADLASDLPEVRVSASELQQVLLNLINNAIDAMDSQGGRLTLRTRKLGKDVQLEVADTGRGIPPANLQRIFDPFFTTKPVGKGTGLGLSICYGAVKKMGGDISVSSKVGEGAVFRVRLPGIEEMDVPGGRITEDRAPA